MTDRRVVRSAVASLGGMVTAMSLVLLATASAAEAQARFEPSTRLADYTTYRGPEECIAAIVRVTDSTEKSIRADTLLFDGDAPLPPAALDAAMRCGAHFTPANVPLARQKILVGLYLTMGRTADAQALVERGLAAARVSPRPGERAKTLAMSVHAYMQARPVLLAPAQKLIAELDGLGSRARGQRVGAHAEVYEYARSVMKTDLLIAEGRALIAATGGLTDEEWMSPSIQETIADAILSTTLPMLRDSSEEAFLRVLRARMRETLGDSYGSRGAGAIGQRAASLGGDFWYRRGDAAPVRPAAGRLSLVVSVDHRCGDACYPAYAMLRRLDRRFGKTLDVTLVSRTFGYFRARPPQTPAEEAEAMRQYFLDELQLPGALVVSSTPFTRRPEPDHRRVNRVTPNDSLYAFEAGAPQSNSAALVDDTGMVVYYTQSLHPRKERELSAVIEFLAAKRPQS